MKNEIINLLKKQNKISDEVAEEFGTIDINEFFNVVKETGTCKTNYIDRERLIANLDTEMFGENIYVYDEVMSTNTLAKFFAEQNFEEGTVIISEKQTKGRGRSGKKWESPLGGIWLSLILRPHVDPSKASLITLATGVAVANTIKSFDIDNVEIKWPNDILINGKKVSGVLTEAVAKLNTIEYIVVGVGIDANLDIDTMPRDLQEDSTSLSNELNKNVDEVEVIIKFLEEFEKVFIEFSGEKYEDILKEWRRESYSIGKYVNIQEPFGNSFDGYIVGINKEGVLIVEKADGTLQKVLSGEYTIKK
ncbi:biotin--[acetyl-CoA-carboxylase] ligase [Methanobrevibacter sp. OttesenSCG-928-K11]|nr:biotin--[acetyl-CoA-carboxylase] ligase [Methanobrevibacter sp. OttesenSCG-928-K11]MDL2270284.1 biotin--[acetyl-CoA-carboxylase] ligase [Methanobrevibacter sp. OttesenSCG-928-I08]